MNKILEFLDTEILIGMQLLKLADVVLILSAIITFLPSTTLFTLVVFTIVSYYYCMNNNYVVSILCLVEVLIKVFYV